MSKHQYEINMITIHKYLDENPGTTAKELQEALGLSLTDVQTATRRLIITKTIRPERVPGFRRVNFFYSNKPYE